LFIQAVQMSLKFRDCGLGFTFAGVFENIPLSLLKLLLTAAEGRISKALIVFVGE
jgi:hypothetical protein